MDAVAGEDSGHGVGVAALAGGDGPGRGHAPELRGGVEDYLAAAARALAPQGRVSVLMDGAQDARCRAAIAAAGLQLVHRLVVLPQPGALARFRGYVAARQGAQDPPTELVVREADRSFSPAMRAIRQAFDLERARG